MERWRGLGCSRSRDTGALLIALGWPDQPQRMRTRRDFSRWRKHRGPMLDVAAELQQVSSKTLCSAPPRPSYTEHHTLGFWVGRFARHAGKLSQHDRANVYDCLSNCFASTRRTMRASKKREQCGHHKTKSHRRELTLPLRRYREAFHCPLKPLAPDILSPNA
jgi:hypothetical protein